MDPVQHDQAHYRQFASHTRAPFVFFFAPLPVFLAACWVGLQVPNRAFLHGALISAILLTLDIVIVAVAGQLGIIDAARHAIGACGKSWCGTAWTLVSSNEKIND